MMFKDDERQLQSVFVASLESFLNKKARMLAPMVASPKFINSWNCFEKNHHGFVGEKKKSGSTSCYTCTVYI